MKAGDLMTTGAARIRADASLDEAVRLMVEHRISGLPVVDAQDKLVGVITEGDFLRRTTAPCRTCSPFWRAAQPPRRATSVRVASRS